MTTIAQRKPLIQIICMIAGISISTLAFATDPNQSINKNLNQNLDLITASATDRQYIPQVNQQNQIKRIIVDNTNANSANAMKSLVSAKTNGIQISNPAMSPAITYKGQEAVDFLGKDLAKIAGNYGFSPEKFKEILLSDATMYVNSHKHMFFVDDTVEQ